MNKKVITLGIIGIIFLGLTLHGAHAQYSENSSGKGYESKERKLKAYGKKRGKGSMYKRKGCLNKEQRGEQKALYENLDDTLKEQFDVLKQEHKDSIKSLHREYREYKGDDSKKAEYIQKKEELFQTYVTDLQVLLGDEHEIIIKMKEYKIQCEEQKALKQEYKQEIEDFKSENSELIHTYKNQFDTTYGSTLDTLNNNQLQKIHFQLKGISRKISENSELSQEELQESKIKIIAFAELIKSYMNSEESNLDIESIIGIQ